VLSWRRPVDGAVEWSRTTDLLITNRLPASLGPAAGAGLPNSQASLTLSVNEVEHLDVGHVKPIRHLADLVVRVLRRLLAKIAARD